ncbi:MAG: DNA polymerase III subunit delta, partial [Chloroflexota bacterium]
MVERQLRLLALAREGIDQGVKERDLGGIMGGAAPFVVQKTVAQARRLSWQDITRHYHQLLETDLAIKQGRLEPDLALELLVADQGARPRAR